MTPADEHDYAAAAVLLGVSVFWLREHISKLPHYKKSLSTRGPGRVTFSDEHIREIRAMFEVKPARPARLAPATRRRSA